MKDLVLRNEIADQINKNSGEMKKCRIEKCELEKKLDIDGFSYDSNSEWCSLLNRITELKECQKQLKLLIN